MNAALPKACWLCLALSSLGCGGGEFTPRATGGAGGSVGGGGGAGGAGATGGASGSGGASSCGIGTVAGVVDDFDDGLVGPQWNTYGSIVSEQSGEATVKFTPNKAPESAGYRSASPLQYSGCSVLVALRKTPTPEAQAGAFLSVRTDNGLNFAELTVFQTQIEAVVKVEGATVADKSDVYDPSEHAWLKLRDDAGTTFFETSKDGISWSVFHSAPTPAILKQARVDFGGTSWGAHDSPGEVRFDDLNRPPK